MPSKRMVPAQEVSDADEDLARLAAALNAEIALLKADFQNASDAADAYCAEIAALTEQRDRWKAIVEAACRFCILNGTKKTQAHNDLAAAVQKLFEREHGFAFAALDAEAAAETDPSLPETPEAP